MDEFHTVVGGTAYAHGAGWENRLVLGDCLEGMNALEAGTVQAIYFDPPYGIGFTSTFQPLSEGREAASKVRKRASAYRDDWREGVATWLGFIEPRLQAVRRLLTPSGSVFLQIGDARMHHARVLLDEVFGPDAHVATIVFRKTGGQRTRHLASTVDYVLWYARDRKRLRFHRLHRDKAPGDAITEDYDQVLLPTGERMPLGRAVRLGIAQEGRVFQATTLTSQNPGSRYDVAFEGRVFRCGPGQWWKTDPEGMRRLARAGRLLPSGRTLRYMRFLDDYPAWPITNLWEDTACSVGEAKRYPVQTHTRVVERCILMSTDPGDLVVDPTCGSGTTPWVAERFGRRWIAFDTSPASIAVTRRRLREVSFEDWMLQDPSCGPAGGLVYESLPHVTMQSITRNPDLEAVLERHDRIREERLADIQRARGAARPWEPWEVPREPEPAVAGAAAEAVARFHAANRVWREEVEATIRTGAPDEARVDRPRKASARPRGVGVFRVVGPPDLAGVPAPSDTVLRADGTRCRHDDLPPHVPLHAQPDVAFDDQFRDISRRIAWVEAVPPAFHLDGPDADGVVHLVVEGPPGAAAWLVDPDHDGVVFRVGLMWSPPRTGASEPPPFSFVPGPHRVVAVRRVDAWGFWVDRVAGLGPGLLFRA